MTIPSGRRYESVAGREVGRVAARSAPTAKVANIITNDPATTGRMVGASRHLCLASILPHDPKPHERSARKPALPLRLLRVFRLPLRAVLLARPAVHVLGVVLERAAS